MTDTNGKAAPGNGKKATAPPVKKPATSTGSREAHRLAAAVLEVLAGERTPSNASAVLGVSVPRYYLLEQRALAGLITGCEPRAKGRRLTEERRITELEKELVRVQHEATRQQTLLRAAQRAVGLLPAKAPAPASPSGGKKGRRRKPTVRALKFARELQTDSVGQALAEAVQQVGEPRAHMESHMSAVNEHTEVR